MRLFTKIFLFGMLVFGLAFSASGYFLLHYSLESSMAREADFALKQFQYDKFTVQSAMLTYSEVSVAVSFDGGFFSGEPGEIVVWQVSPEGIVVPKGDGILEGEALPESQSPWIGLTERFFESLAEEISVPVAFFAEDKTPLYSEIEGLDTAFLDSLSEDAHVYRFWGTPEGAGIPGRTAAGGSVLAGTVLDWNMSETAAGTGNVEGDLAQDPVWSLADKAQDPAQDAADAAKSRQRIYFVTQWDISKTVSQQEILRQYFVRCYLAAVAMGMVLLGILSAFLTGPLKRMSKAARRMAEGYYEERLEMSGRDEIGELAESFNQMAGAVEEKISELSKAAREKEDFVSNFAHELKTPLTSIIGYADTIYQKDLPRETVRRASWHIWNEGMRLEALSLKLMELTVLGRQEFPLQEMSAEELFADVAESMAPVFSEKQADFGLDVEPAYIMADCDLLKTLLLNLLDNSVKAGGRRLELSGHRRGGRYRISVKDDGCGMEEAELSRITEAFYMVDKARSRKQHGAGLGLALADRIAGVHGSRLSFKSREGTGTEVSFDVECGKGGVEDEAI